MLTIYGAHRSRATRTYWLALELGLAFTAVPVLQARRLDKPLAPDAPLNTASPAFLAINPMGQIPCIDDDGLVVIESMAINLHLAKKHGGPLSPQNLAEDTQATMWSFFAATGMETETLRISSAIGRADSEAGQMEVAVASRLLQRPLAMLEAHLATHGYLIGGRFTVADINAGEVVRYAQGASALMDAHPAIKAWLETIQSRPAFRQMWALREAEAV